MTTLAFIGMMNAAQAQCDNLLSYEVDEFSGKGNWANKEQIILSDNGVDGMYMMLLMANDTRKTLIWITTSTEVGCVDKGKKVELVFTDGERMTLYSEGTFNCKGKATCYFGNIFGKKSEMQKLATTTIDMIRVQGSSTSHSEKLKPQTAEYFKSTFSCLVEEMKK
jgi:hypothetical protein